MATTEDISLAKMVEHQIYRRDQRIKELEDHVERLSHDLMEVRAYVNGLEPPAYVGYPEPPGASYAKDWVQR